MNSCHNCGARAGAVCRRIDCAQLKPKAFTEAAPLTKALSMPTADMPAAYHGAFVELPEIRQCLSCGGRHAIDPDGGLPCGH